MVSDKEVGHRIYAARKDTGLTQRQLAAQVGVSERTIVRWEKGWNHPRGAYLTRLANALGVDVSLLIEELVA